MSMPIEEHDYMGLSDVSSRDNCDNNGLNLKATELRLGLPGFESPERDTEFCINDVNVCTPKGVLSSGAKRDFSDTIVSAPGKWSLFNDGGSEVDMVKNGVLFSPRSVNGGKINGVGVCESNSQSTVMASCAEKVVSSQVLKKKPQSSAANEHGAPSSARAQVIGWPPIRSFRKNSMTTNPPKNDKNADAMLASSCIYVKVSMDGAPYLRKVDLRIYSNYSELSSGLEKMFSCFTIGQCGSHEVSDQHGLSEGRSMELLHGSEYVLTYEDKDGDWMLVGDVPWDMFIESCKRMRIMNSSDAVGLAPKAMEKCRTVTNVLHTRL